MLTALERALAPRGLNLLGATTPSAYDEGVPPAFALARLVPEARGVIVIGNGGGAFWTAFRAHCRQHPGDDMLPDPLDAFTERVVEGAVRPLLGPEVRILYPFRFPDEPVSFVRLAQCAGLGRPSLTGVLVHPVFGPWIALRAAVLVRDAIDAPRPADGFDPCPGCVERACIPACPVGAVGPAGWDVARCATHRLGSGEGCASRCEARFQCVVGREHAIRRTRSRTIRRGPVRCWPRSLAAPAPRRVTRAAGRLGSPPSRAGRGTRLRVPGRAPTPRA